MSCTTPDNTAQAIIDLVLKHSRPELMTVKGQDGQADTEILVTPAASGGRAVVSVKSFLDEYRPAPERRTGTATMQTLGSLIQHTLRFKDDDSAVFANRNPSAPSLTTVFNYHASGHDGAPRFGDHRAVYAFPLSDEWKAWVEQDGKKLTQTEFAEFLENRLCDVESPPDLADVAPDDTPTRALMAMIEKLGGTLAGPGRLLDLSRGLKVSAEEKVQQMVNLSNGETQMQFTHQHRDDQGAPLKVPNMFLVNIPVFVLGEAFRVPVRLRYRVRDGVISWSYHLHRVDQVFDAAFGEACAEVETRTGLPLFFGKPEAKA